MTTIKERASELLDKIGDLTIAARAVAHKDGRPTKAELTALDEALAAVTALAEIDHSEVLAVDRDAAAQHLEHLAATIYTGQTEGALQNAANDLRAGAHIKPEAESEETADEAEADD